MAIIEFMGGVEVDAEGEVDGLISGCPPLVDGVVVLSRAFLEGVEGGAVPGCLDWSVEGEAGRGFHFWAPKISSR
jgi:hypothetical protein